MALNESTSDALLKVATSTNTTRFIPLLVADRFLGYFPP